MLANTVPFVLLAYGEQHVDSVLAGLLNATTPLMTLLFVPLLVPDRADHRAPGGRAVDRVRGRAVRSRGVARRRRRDRHGDARVPRLHRELRRHVRVHAALLRRPQRLGCGAVRGPARLRERRARGRRPRARRPAALARRPGRRRVAGTRCARHGLWRTCSTSGSSGPRDRPSPRRSPTSSRSGRRPSGPCCWPNRWAGTRLSGVSWWSPGSSSPAFPTEPEGGCATGPARGHAPVSFGVPCRALVALDVTVRA